MKSYTNKKKKLFCYKKKIMIAIIKKFVKQNETKIGDRKKHVKLIFWNQNSFQNYYNSFKIKIFEKKKIIWKKNNQWF